MTYKFYSNCFFDCPLLSYYSNLTDTSMHIIKMFVYSFGWLFICLSFKKKQKKMKNMQEFLLSLLSFTLQRIEILVGCAAQEYGIFA